MADLIFNVAKGRGIQMAKNVKDNNPIAAVLRIFAIVSTDTDATTIPMSLHNFAVTPNGGDVVADFPVTGFFRAS